VSSGSLKVRALYEFWAQNSAELSFQPGEVITVISQEDPGWWEGELHGIRGLFPSNYVEIIVGGAVNSHDFSFVGDGTGALVPTAYQSSIMGGTTGFETFAQLSPEEFEQLQRMQNELITQLQSQGIDTSGLFDANAVMQQVTQEMMKNNVAISQLPIQNYNIELAQQQAGNGYVEMSNLSGGDKYNQLDEGQIEGKPNTKKKSPFEGKKDRQAGVGFWLGARSYGPGFRWINALGLLVGLFAILGGLTAIVLSAIQKPFPAPPPIPHLIDINFTQYVGLYTICAGLFTCVLEYFHIRVGENSFCPMASRAVVYVFLSIYMFLSIPTIGVAALYLLLLAPMQVYYDKAQSPNGWITINPTR